MNKEQGHATADRIAKSLEENSMNDTQLNKGLNWIKGKVIGIPTREELAKLINDAAILYNVEIDQMRRVAESNITFSISLQSYYEQQY